MAFTVMALPRARLASQTAMNALMEPPVPPVMLVMKTALPRVTPVQLVITKMLPTAHARNAATIVMFALLKPPVQPVRLALD